MTAARSVETHECEGGEWWEMFESERRALREGEGVKKKNRARGMHDVLGEIRWRQERGRKKEE